MHCSHSLFFIIAVVTVFGKLGRSLLVSPHRGVPTVLHAGIQGRPANRQMRKAFVEASRFKGRDRGMVVIASIAI